MNGDITLEARWHWRSSAEVISPFNIFAVFDVSFRHYKLQFFYIFINVCSSFEQSQSLGLRALIWRSINVLIPKLRVSHFYSIGLSSV